MTAFFLFPIGNTTKRKKGRQQGPLRATYTPNVHTPDLEGLGTRRKLLVVLHNGA